MTGHRHEFWHARGRKETSASRFNFPHHAMLRESRVLFQGEPALSGRFGQSARERRQRLAIEDSSELEFSDFGRDARFLPGWWILPGFLVGLLACALGLSGYL
jgi:hypothetical protein